MKHLILLLIMSCTFGGEVKLSPTVEKALMQFDVETLKAKVEHDKKIVELKKGLITKLEREISVASQAGDLDLAVAIKEVKDGLVNEITPKVVPAPVKKKDYSGKYVSKTLGLMIIKLENGVYSLNEQDTGHHSTSSQTTDDGVVFQWSNRGNVVFESLSDGTFKFTWSIGPDSRPASHIYKLK